MDDQARTIRGDAKPGRIASLDGLRAVSISMVVLLHTFQRVSATRHVSSYWFLLGNGNTGVYIFFVISGFLITSLLLREFAARERISLRQFYLRRAFRILPAAYCYIAAIGVLAWMGIVEVSPADLSAAALFSSNYIHQAWPLEHFWTLAIEEQFYLAWPVVLASCLHFRRRRLAAGIAASIVFVCPLVRTAQYFIAGPYLRSINGATFEGRADCLMFGCLLALLCGSEPFESFYRAASRVMLVFPVTLILISGFMEVRFGNHWYLPAGITIDGFCIALFLIWCVRNPASFVGRFLNARPVAWIGVLSYSIYIWQQIFLNGHSVSIFGKPTAGNLIALYALTLLAASISHYCIERPFLRYRQRIEERSKPATVPAGQAA